MPIILASCLCDRWCLILNFFISFLLFFRLQKNKNMSIKNKIIIDFYFFIVYNTRYERRIKMAKIIKYIALTHTPSTHIICIPAKVVKDMDISTDTIVQVEYDTETRVMKLTKIKE